MGSINQAIVLGHLGRDAEMRTTQGGRVVANFTVATTDRWRDKSSGELVEKTEWHRIVLWGKQAEALEPYLKKGKQVCVQGPLETRKWEKDGVDRYTTEIRARQVTLLGKVERADDPPQTPAQPGAQTPEVDDIPF